MTDSHSRRTCPACARRYGGLVDPACRVCQGIGTLGLGAAALAQHSAPAVARSVELFLELRAQAAGPLPVAQRGDALEAAVLDLRSAGVLAYGLTAGATGEPGPRGAAEVAATRLTRELAGKPVPTAVPAALTAPPLPLEDARPDRVTALASANGSRAHLARVADPIHPLGPDLLHLDTERRTLEHGARVLAGAAHHLTRPRKRARTA